MSTVVYALDTVNIMMPDGQMVLIQKDEKHYDDEDVVRLKPFLFTDDDRQVKARPTAIGADGQPVEQATANPGERRSVKRG